MGFGCLLLQMSGLPADKSGNSTVTALLRCQANGKRSTAANAPEHTSFVEDQCASGGTSLIAETFIVCFALRSIDRGTASELEGLPQIVVGLLRRGALFSHQH
jgi:hypothetical protein